VAGGGNDFNPNIPRYVGKHEDEKESAIAAGQQEIENLQTELAKTRAEMTR
jgi:type I restriction-modification system DNA methylase subunit